MPRPIRHPLNPLAFVRLTLLALTFAAFTLPGVVRAVEMTRTPPPLNDKGEGELLTGTWPRAMALDSAGNLWVANGFDGTVIRIDEATGKQLAGGPFKVGKQPTAILWDEPNRTLWAASYEDANIVPVTTSAQGQVKIGSPIALGSSRPVGLALSSGALWVITQVEGRLASDNNLIKITIPDGKIAGQLTVGRFPTAIISTGTDSNPDDHILFVANGHDDNVSVIDTKAEGGKGKVIATLTSGIPAFPVALSFDGSFLYVGGYDCKYDGPKCQESQLGRIAFSNGETAPFPGPAQTGRQVSTFFRAGNVVTSSGHGEGITENTVGSTAQTLEIIRGAKASPAGRSSYFGTVMMTKRFIYIADWTNDRIIRIAAPPAVQVLPTPTAAPVTPTSIPPTAPPATAIPLCNPDPNFPPRLKVGDKARVIVDDFTNPLNIRKEPNFSNDSRTGKQFQLGDEFTVLTGPVSNNKDIDPKTNSASCFYEVVGVKDPTFKGFVTEGGLTADDTKRYYIEPVKS